MSAGEGQPLRVELLGTVRAFRTGVELPLGPPRQRAVLAMLALAGNRVVGRDELVDGVWGPDPPASVVNQLHVLVGGLRRVLEPERTRRAAGQLLTLAGSGYRLSLPPEALDVTAFEAGLRRAARPAPRWPAMAGRCRGTTSRTPCATTGTACPTNASLLLKILKAEQDVTTIGPNTVRTRPQDPEPSSEDAA